jgi:hypothetical protein
MAILCVRGQQGHETLTTKGFHGRVPEPGKVDESGNSQDERRQSPWAELGQRMTFHLAAGRGEVMAAGENALKFGATRLDWAAG